MECPKCGQRLGSHQVHPEAQCDKQQEVNRKNRGECCRWCGYTDGSHKPGCPRECFNTPLEGRD
jgi:hypothetical protein